MWSLFAVIGIFNICPALYSSRQRNIMEYVRSTDMDDMTLKEAGENIARQINCCRTVCQISRAVKMAIVWLIPKGTEKPADL